MLKRKHAKFVTEYAVDLNATQAAIRAGYSEKTAYSIGCRLLKIPEIAAAIADNAKQHTDEAGITVQDVLKGLKREADGLGPDTNAGARVSALGWLGKYFKLWVEKHEHRHNFDDLTDEQLQARLDAILSKTKAAGGG